MDTIEITQTIRELRQLTVGELREKYLEVFGEANRSRNKDYLIRRIAWRIQANAEGGITERAKLRAQELANEADIRVRFNRSQPQDSPAAHQITAAIKPGRDPRLPLPGSSRSSIRWMPSARLARHSSPASATRAGRYNCSFVSVTQQFNTSHSMVRLTLNTLLSFAQFEREIIAGNPLGRWWRCKRRHCRHPPYGTGRQGRSWKGSDARSGTTFSQPSPQIRVNLSAYSGNGGRPPAEMVCARSCLIFN